MFETNEKYLDLLDYCLDEDAGRGMPNSNTTAKTLQSANAEMNPRPRSSDRKADPTPKALAPRQGRPHGAANLEVRLERIENIKRFPMESRSGLTAAYNAKIRRLGTRLLAAHQHQGLDTFVWLGSGPEARTAVLTGHVAEALAASGLRVALIHNEGECGEAPKAPAKRLSLCFGVPETDRGITLRLMHSEHQRRLLRINVSNGQQALDELLMKRGVGQLLGQVREAVDVMMIDLGAANDVPLTRSSVLGRSGVVLVVQAERTRVAAVRRRIGDLTTLGCNIVGVVLNGEKSYLPNFLRRL